MNSEKLKILYDIFGSYKRQGSEILFYCPFCDHHKKKLSVNFKKDAFKCWVCGAAGFKVHRLVRKFGSYTQKKQWAALDDELVLNNFEERFRRFFEGEQEEENYEIEMPEGFRSLTGNITIKDLKPLNYLKSRGVTKRDILRWKIGYCASGKYKDRIIVPSFNLQGGLNYFVARTYANEWPTYTNPPVPRSKIIFNELFIDWTKDLIVVEGVFDALKAGNAVPILGSSLSPTSKLFEAIALHDTPIYLALDNDAEKKSMQIIKNALQYDIELYKIDTEGIDDVGSISKYEFSKRKDNAVRIDRNNYFEFIINRS